MTPIRTLLKPYRTILWLHQWLPRRSLRRLRVSVSLLCVLSGLTTIAAMYTGAFPVLAWFGLTLVLFGIWLDLFMLYAYTNSRYFYGLESVSGSEGKRAPGLQYLSALTLAKHPQDCVAGFFQHENGEHIMTRLGLTATDVETFLTTSRTRLTHDSLSFPSDISITLMAVAEKIYDEDPALRAWLLTHKIDRALWLYGVALVEKILVTAMLRERWWSRDNLSRQQSLGQELAFGHHSFINSVSRRFEQNAVLNNSQPVYDAYVDAIGNALAKGKASNVLLLGTEGGGVIDVLARLKHQFMSGQQLRSLHHPHLYEIDMDVFFSRFPTAEVFADNFERLLREAASAGNIILIFTHFSAILERSEALGLDLATIIDDYLISPALHIIAVDSPQAYHQHLHQRSDLTRYFTEIVIDTTDLATLKTIVTDYIVGAEARYQTTFTVSGIAAVVTDAARYLTDGEMPDRAITLAESILSHAERHQLPMVTADEVHTFVSNLTNIPIGPVGAAEGELLVHLEEYLDQYVAGQPTAVRAIARTMRRARADIERHNKPIGSFLFLGPTGVGKTETAKTLARVFFKNEDAMTRFDMSEFSQRDALLSFIGTNDMVGKLSSALLNQPYTVLLLDEFEKAHRSVHDLFLQILDEGYFTAGSGERINAQTTIIIATSNAGSDLIARTITTRKETPHLTSEVIKVITETGVFRPELINRFDNTIVFEPLNDRAREQVTLKFLGQLMDRLAAQGYTVRYDDSIVALIMQEGFDPAYGARPLQRFIQNLLEDYLAKAMLEQKLQPGQLYTLTASLFSPETIEIARQ